MKTVKNFVKSEVHPFPDYVNSFLSQDIVVPFEKMKHEDFKCIVEPEERVNEGQVIAVSSDESIQDVVAKIHSPYPGIVKEIVPCSLPEGKMGIGARIELEGSFSYLGKKAHVNDWTLLSAEEICRKFSDNGVINTFNKPKSLALEIQKNILKKNRILVVRLFDEDPSRVTESFIGSKFQEEMITGARIIAKAFNAEGIIFVLPKKSDVKLDYQQIAELPYKEIRVKTNRYPSGFLQFLVPHIKNELRNEDSESIFNSILMYELFVDAPTVLNAYEAVVHNKPVMECFVHVTGNCLPAKGMFRVKIGTTIRSLVEHCGGFKRKPEKIIINGIITGFAVTDLDTPVTKIVKSIIFDADTEMNNQNYTNCMRCGNCRRICPVGIYPDLMFRHKTGGKPVGEDLMNTADLCTGCSLCNSVCPARLPLSQNISLIKEMNDEQ